MLRKKNVLLGTLPVFFLVARRIYLDVFAIQYVKLLKK